MKDCPEGSEEWVKSILDHFEDRVNSALRLLKDVKGLDTLGNIEKCKTELESISDNLY